MRKYVNATKLLEAKALNKEKKPIYATRKLSIGLVSCMLGLVLLAPRSMADENIAQPAKVTAQSVENKQDQPQDPKLEPVPVPAQNPAQAETPANTEPTGEVKDKNQPAGEVENQTLAPATGENQTQNPNPAQGEKPAETPVPVSQQGQSAPGTDSKSETSKTPSEEKSSQSSDQKTANTGKEEKSADPAKKSEQTPHQNTEENKKTEGKAPADKKESEKKKVSIKPEDVLTEEDIYAIRQKTFEQENSYFFNGEMEEKLRSKIVAAIKENPNADLNELKKTLIAEAIAKNTPTQEAPGETKEAKEIDPKLTKPTINNVPIGESTITGNGLAGSGRRNHAKGPCKINVTVNDAEGHEVETKIFTIEKGKNPKKGEPQWSVTLDKPVQKGYTIVAQQELDGKFSNPSETYTVKELLKESYEGKLQMPKLDVWSEDMFVPEADAIEDIINAFKEKNNNLDNVENKNFEGNLYVPKSGDKTKPLSVDWDNKKINVTFSDKSTLEVDFAGKVNLKEITQKSNPAEVENLTIVNNEIKGKISGNGPFKRARVTIVKFNNETSKKNYCESGKCTVDKNATELATILVNETTGEFTYKITDNNLLKLGEDIGITVKEYRKKTNCKTIRPQIKIPKVDVRDPNKLTPTEKAKIIEEIRKANTVAGVSKLPDGTGDNTGIPAIIQIDDQGNVKIIDGNDVKVKDWDSNGNAIPETNGDGLPIFKEGKGSSVAETKTKEIVTNLAPNPPTVGYDKKTGEISVTPDKADTDAKKITVKYKDPDGNDQEVTVEKADGENGKWSAPEGSKVTVNPDTGVVTIKDSDIKNKTDVSAIVTDNGGINTVVENDTKAKDSKNKSETIKVFPKKPEITVDDKTGDVTIKPIDKDGDRVARKMDITYIPAGQTNPKTVTVDRDKDGKLTVTGEPDFKVSEDGKSIIITNDKIKSKSKITALTNDGDADPNQVLKSDESEGNVPDKTAPKPPTVEVNTSDGTAHITPPSDPDVKTIEVKYPGADGNEKTFTAKKTDTGWEISGDDGVTFEMNGYISIPYNKLKKADTITATAKDEDGNVSKPGTDISLPPAPGVKLDEDKGVITVTPPTDKAPSVDGMEITYTPDGEGASETKLVAKKVEGKWKIENIPDGVTIDKDSGVVTITNDKAKAQSKVIAYSSIDTEKKSLDKGEETVPESTPPQAPTVKVQDNGSVTITPKNEGETTVTVTYKDKEGKDKTATATKGKNGKWTIVGTNGEEIDGDSGVITIPNGNTNPGDRVKATASKGKKTSKENDDLTKPAPPTVTPNQTSGDVTITPPTKGNVDGMIIKYKKPDDSEGTIKVKKGNGGTWTFDENNPDPEGVEVDGQSGKVTIKKGHAKEKTPVTADSTIETLKTPDKNKGEQPEQVPDKTAPNPPTVIVEENTGNVTITPPKDTDTTKVTVNYKDKDGNDKTAIAKKGDNGWEMEKAENGESVDEKGVITLKKGSYKTGVEVKAYGNDDANNKSDEDNKTPVQVTYEGNGAVSGSMDNKILLMGSEYTLPTCDYTAPANKKFKAWKVGNVEKAPNEIIQINADTKISPVWEDITHDVIFDGNGGSNTMDKKTLPQGSEYNLPENGFTAPEGKEFDGWMVGTEKKSVGDKIKVDKDTEVKAIWKDIEFKVSFDGNSGSGSMGGASVKKGGKYTLPENGFTAPSENQEFKTWEVDGKEMAAGSEITINKNTVVKAVWKNKEKPVEPSKPEPKPNPDQPNPEKPVEPGKPETPEKPVEPGQPETPEKPVEPGKPETPERPVEPGKQENPEKPVETDKPVLDLPSKEKPEEPEKIDTLAPSVSYAKEEDKKEDVDKQIEKTKKTQIKDVSPVKIPRAGDRPNVKTGVESVAGLAVTLVAASGGLFITRKKEDEE